MSSFNSRLQWGIGMLIVAVVAIFMLQPATFGQNKDREATKERMRWSHVSSNLDMSVRRTRVPGGWFVSIGDSRDSDSPRSTFFYYDPEHAWDGTSQPN
jgi:hypothetical protein